MQAAAELADGWPDGIWWVDLAAVTVPNGFTADGRPASLTVYGPAFSDETLSLFAASLTVGVRFRLPRDYSLAFAVGEDVHPHSMPDVTFSMQLKAR